MRTVYLSLLFTSLVGCAAHQSQQAPKLPAMPSHEEMMKIAAPGDQHAKLEKMVGSWKYTVQMWMDPSGKPEIMKGYSTNRMILGKRFLMQEALGIDKKHPFQGMGFTGYDNVKGQYVSTWVDTMSTGIMSSTGTFNTATNSIDESGTISCPMSGSGSMPFRAQWKFIDNNHYSYEMFVTMPDGKEAKSVEIQYSRLKKS